MNHDSPQPPPPEAMLTDDPELWLATADAAVWELAHPCECPDLCECDE